MTSKINERYILIALFLVAYLFSFGMRMIWVYQFQGYPDLFWNGQLMINTNDGYYFASGAQKYLEGTLQFNPRVPEITKTAAIAFTALATKYLPFSLESTVLYMPAVVSSLIVIPVILIGRLLGSTLVGFLSALIGSIAWSYYNRTMTGYFDTDMFSAMAPMFILYFLLATIKTEQLRFALFASLAVLVYPFLYDQGRAIVYAMGLLYIGYMLLFHRKDDFTYYSILLISVGLLNLSYIGQFLAIVLIYLALLKNLIPVQIAKYISVVTVLSCLYFGHVFSLIAGKVMLYFSRGVETEGLKFFQVSQTVREAGLIPFETMANRISGSVPGVIAALAGYLLLVYKHRPMILALPLIGIGVFSLAGGLRFTVYAVPVAAISAVYLFHSLANFSDKAPVRIALPAMLTLLMLYPNIAHIIDYKVPTVFNKQEVQLLSDLKQRSSAKDYVVTWWDYGYPVWFYAGKNTLIDGGKHNQDNFIISQIFSTHSQLEAARLARISVEHYIDTGYAIVADSLFKNHQPDQLNVKDYLENLRYGEITMPDKTVDIYFYLPLRMLDILPTVNLFSNRDLNSGKAYDRPFFYATQNFKDTKDAVLLGNDVALMKNEGTIRLGNQKAPLNSLYKTAYRNGKLQIQQQKINLAANLSVIYMTDYNRILIVDQKMLNSTFIQMFIFENFDHTLFEPVTLHPLAKIYRLKI